MKNWSRKVRLSWLIWLLLLCFPIQGLAAKETKEAPSKQAAFTVEMVDSDHQINPELPYFNLRVSPDEDLDLQFRLKNHTKQPLTVLVSPAFGMTNDNGVIGYETDLGRKEAELGTVFPEIVTVDPSVWLDAEEEKVITAHVKMPPEAFKGILLGAFSFKEAPPPPVVGQEKKQQGIAIHTDYAYLIGVELSEDEEILPEKVELFYVTPNQIDGKNVFTVALKHPVSQLLNDVELVGKIYAAKDKNNQKPLYTSKQKDIRLAPNANYQWQIALPDQQFKAGDYRLELEVNAGENHWKFQREFEVTKEDAKKFNSDELFVSESPSKGFGIWGWLLLGLCGLLVGLGIAAYWREPKVRRYVKRAGQQLWTHVNGLWKRKQQPAVKPRRQKKIVGNQVVKKKPGKNRK